MDPMRVHELASARIPPGNVDIELFKAVISDVRREELEKHKWLVEDTLTHLARIDASPYSFLVLEKSNSSIKGSLYFLGHERWKTRRETFFCEVSDSPLKLPDPLNKLFRGYIDHYRVCEFTVALYASHTYT